MKQTLTTLGIILAGILVVPIGVVGTATILTAVFGAIANVGWAFVEILQFFDAILSNIPFWVGRTLNGIILLSVISGFSIIVYSEVKKETK